jgi:ribosome-associated protein
MLSNTQSVATKKTSSPKAAAATRVSSKEAVKTKTKAKSGEAKATAGTSQVAIDERLLALALNCARACADKKAEDLVILNVGHLTSYADYFVLCSGKAERQVQAIGNHVLSELKAAGLKPFGFEGLEEGQWGLIDCGDIIVHVFSEEARSHYDLDGLWADAKRVEFSDK